MKNFKSDTFVSFKTNFANKCKALFLNQSKINRHSLHLVKLLNFIYSLTEDKKISQFFAQALYRERKRKKIRQ